MTNDDKHVREVIDRIGETVGPAFTAWRDATIALFAAVKIAAEDVLSAPQDRDEAAPPAEPRRFDPRGLEPPVDVHTLRGAHRVDGDREHAYLLRYPLSNGSGSDNWVWSTRLLPRAERFSDALDASDFTWRNAADYAVGHLTEVII